MVVAEDVQEAVQGQDASSWGSVRPSRFAFAGRGVHADHDVPEAGGLPDAGRAFVAALAGRTAGVLVAGPGEREDVGGLVLPAVAVVERADGAVAGEHQRDLTPDRERIGGAAQDGGQPRDVDARRRCRLTATTSSPGGWLPRPVRMDQRDAWPAPNASYALITDCTRRCRTTSFSSK